MHEREGVFAGAVTEGGALNVIGGKEFSDSVVNVRGLGDYKMQTTNDFVDCRGVRLPGYIGEDVVDAGMRAADDNDRAAGRVKDERDFGHVAEAR